MKKVKPRPIVKKAKATSRAIPAPGTTGLPPTRLRAFKVGSHLPNLPLLQAELQDMTDVLLGRVDPPIQAGVLTLQEVADAYFARASEITMAIQDGEREGSIAKGSNHYSFRTGTLRTFMEMCKRAGDLGSRRLTAEALALEQARVGRDLDLGRDME